MGRPNAVGNSDGAQIINQCFERSFSPNMLIKHSEICMLIELRQSRHWQMKWHFMAHTVSLIQHPDKLDKPALIHTPPYNNHSQGAAWFINISLPWRWKKWQKTKIQCRENQHGERMHFGEEPASKTALSDLSDQSTNEIQFRKNKAPHLHSNRQTVSCALLEHATVTYGKCSKSVLKNIYLNENAKVQDLGDGILWKEKCVVF